MSAANTAYNELKWSSSSSVSLRSGALGQSWPTPPTFMQSIVVKGKKTKKNLQAFNVALATWSSLREREYLQGLWRHTDDWVSRSREADLLCNLFATAALRSDLSTQNHSSCGHSHSLCSHFNHSQKDLWIIMRSYHVGVSYSIHELYLRFLGHWAVSL